MTLANDGRERKGVDYTDEALRIFPRYQVLNAILVEVEGFIPQSFSAIEEARAFIMAAGRTAEDVFTRNPDHAIQKKSIEEERAAFIQFIQTLSIEDMDLVEPLPYRRVLTIGEQQHVWARLQDRWQVDTLQAGRYPLTEGKNESVVTFQAGYVDEEVGAGNFRAALTTHGLTRVWEIREYGPAYEMDLALLEPYYNGAEGYWCSNDMDWIIYASHESFITIGGWLLEDIKNIWPQWKKRIWTTPF